MTEDQWKKVDQLLNAALELEPEARTRFIAEACVEDLRLRREVESLLDEMNHVDQFMERPAVETEAESLFGKPSGALRGRFLGHYRIDSLIGTGGMAEVYRAFDTRLARDVAIKVLHDVPFHHGDYRGRFQREAQLLASLNHPNVASIYGIEEEEGICGLVMELIDGETLSERIARQRPSVKESLEIARQIAVAVETAHSKGIIHRDLKPSNIKIRLDGAVKVLDFGLAMLFEARENPNGSSKSVITQSLLIQGTVSYMSPEQACGERVNRQTDIWAWGCVLYEMLTGSRAFHGETPMGTIGKIAAGNPDWTRIPESTPASVRSVLRQCLEKDLNRRLHDIADVQVPLQEGAKPASANDREIALSVPVARALFLLIQIGYLTMYCAALYYTDGLDGALMAAGLEPVALTLPLVIVSAMTGIAVRLYLLSSVSLAHPALGQKFRRLFPFLLILDGAWAASPLLAIRSVGFGIALAGAAALAYLPFSQRTLIQQIYPRTIE